MPICAKAEIVMWIQRFCSHRRRLSSIQTQQQLRYLKLLWTRFIIIFIILTLNIMTSLRIHLIPTTSLRHISNSQPHPTLNPLPIVMDRLEVHVTILSTDSRHPLLVEERPARCLYPGQLIGLLFPQETARITATVGRLVGTDGNCAIFALSGTWCRHEHLAIPLRWIWVVEDWREQWKCWGRNLSGRIFLPIISFDFYDFMIWFFFFMNSFL